MLKALFTITWPLPWSFLIQKDPEKEITTHQQMKSVMYVEEHFGISTIESVNAALRYLIAKGKICALTNIQHHDVMFSANTCIQEIERMCRPDFYVNVPRNIAKRAARIATIQ